MVGLEELEQADRCEDLTLQVEITRLTFDKFAITALMSAIGTVGATSMLAAHYNDVWLWKLTGVMALVCIFRIVLPLLFERRGSADLTPDTAKLWQRAHACGTALNCCTITASTLYNFRYHDHTAQFICTLGIFILCAGLGATFGLQPRYAQLCGLGALSALTWSIFQAHDSLLARAGGLMIGLFALLFCKLVASKYEMVVEQLRLKRMMSYLAEHDNLTGLANRRQFEFCVSESCKKPDTFAVLFLDLDGFKMVNDTHGHATGDTLLQQVAKRLSETALPADLVARLGGDEFAILHRRSATVASTQALSCRILAAVSAPYSIKGHSIRIGTSIGIQLSAPGSNDPNRLLSEADAALYEVKQAGKGGFRFVESPAVAVIAGSCASAPDAGQSAFEKPHHGARGRGKLLVGSGQQIIKQIMTSSSTR